MLRDDGKTGSQGRRRWLYASVPDAFRCQRDAQDNLRPGPFLALHPDGDVQVGENLAAQVQADAWSTYSPVDFWSSLPL